eukprot:CAMPEP_0184714822 /NCGR_PEP_ID=MMETSP0314-20130426/4870_1 /TAXON_ID=38298 /ORGANISM="Rhodella maculata, Strain CCMP 736" /LENGTH=492 /DNA_ID=CAMNT_0027177815 /DNA_START=122 /DNA_END=1597 /DNA_ORIENTATION=-
MSGNIDVLLAFTEHHRALRLLLLAHRLDDLFLGDARLEEHAPVVRPPQQAHREGPAQHDASEYEHGAVVVGGPEEDVEAHRADVAAGADDAGDGAGGDGVDVGDDAKGGALGHLDEEGEEDEHDDGAGNVVHAGEDDKHDALHEEEDEEGPEAAAHAVLLASIVGADAAEGAGEEVHEAEEAGDEAGSALGDAEVVLEVGGEVAVHDELDAEAEGVGDVEDPDTPVENGASHGHEGVGLGFGAGLDERGVVAVGAVIGEDVEADAADQEGDRREDHNGAPRLVVGEAEGLHHVEELRHEDVGDAAPEVTPASGDGVSSTDDGEREHDGGPELGDDESRTDEADEEAKGAEDGVRLGDTNEANGNGAEAKEETLGEAGAVAITDRPDDEAEQDSSRDSDDVGVDALRLFREAKLRGQLDGVHERGDGEPAEEGKEEGEPRKVEGAHVRPRELKDDDLERLVGGVDGEVEHGEILLVVVHLVRDIIGLSLAGCF